MRRNKIYDLYNEHAKHCDPADFSGQVKRSINGQVVGEDQIDMIIDAIMSGLEIRSNDNLLDLCCGNGVLTDRILAGCNSGTGVDFSEYLIGIACKNFETVNRKYVLDDVESFLTTASDPERFTKTLCYSSFQYFSEETARCSLVTLRKRFPNVNLIFLGNLPDRARLEKFYFADKYVNGIERDNESSIGMWRTQAELSELAESCGWRVCFQFMPATFYAAHYRYDAVLMRR